MGSYFGSQQELRLIMSPQYSNPSRMLELSHRHRYFFYQGVTDMRKSFHGLVGLVYNELERNPLSGDVYIFLNRRRDKIKLLSWEVSGFSIYYKHLEKGTYELPRTDLGGRDLELKREELLLILEGIELSSVKRRKRFCLTDQKK